MRGEGHNVTSQVKDVSDRDAVTALADAAAGLGRVTHLVHTAGVSPIQAPTERVLQVDLLGTALVLEAFGRVIAPGGAGLVISSMDVAGGYPSAIEHALATTATSQLLARPGRVRGRLIDQPSATSSRRRQLGQICRNVKTQRMDGNHGR